MKQNHNNWMSHCVTLAEKGRGKVSPNPLVGACVVKKGRLIAEGYHARLGGPHAEVTALARAGKRAQGADLYVSLEPCSTYGKTPPCTEAILRSGVKRVIVGVPDPNPKHFRRGMQILRKAGLQVESGFEQDKIHRQNESFFTYHERKRPFVIVKVAQSLDGKITTVREAREWISSRKAREWTHRLRSQVDAVLVGTRTVAIDNPRLTPYLLNHGSFRKNPVRIVLDRKLRLKKNARVFGTDAKTIVFTSNKNPVQRQGTYPVREREGRLDVGEILRKLYSLGITSLLVEGGGEIIASFLEKKLVDKVYLFVAPFFLGGRTAVTSVEGKGVVSVKKAIRLKEITSSRVGKDFMIEGYLA